MNLHDLNEYRKQKMQNENYQIQVRSLLNPAELKQFNRAIAQGQYMLAVNIATPAINKKLQDTYGLK